MPTAYVDDALYKNLWKWIVCTWLSASILRLSLLSSALLLNKVLASTFMSTHAHEHLKLAFTPASAHLIIYR